MSRSNIANMEHRADGIPAELAERLRAGEASALEELMQAYFDRIARFAYTIVKSRSEAEDIAQESFARLWSVRENLDVKRPLKSFLFQTARNLSFDKVKHYKVVDKHVIETPAPLDSESILITTIAVQSAIDNLPERRGLAVRLRFQEQMSYAEVGEVLGISAKAAEQLVIRGVAGLRKQFALEV